MKKDDLTLIANNLSISGWESIRVTRGIERCPNDFEISMTERFPGEADGVVVKPGDPCTVKIGDDLVITGYIDRYHPSITPTGHTVRITGGGSVRTLSTAPLSGRIARSSRRLLSRWPPSWRSPTVSTWAPLR